jgi:hypothetical protein
MTVYVVVKAVDQGQVVGVFTTENKAATYITNHPYSGFITIPCVVDEKD